MDYTQLMTAISSAAQAELAPRDGTVVVAESLAQARKYLDSAPRGWRLIMHWEGYGEHPQARHGMVDHLVATVIQAPRGLEMDPSPILPRPNGRPAFSTYISAVTDLITAMRFPDGTNADSAGFSLAGSQWLETVPDFAAHVLNWKVTAAIPAFKQHIILNFPHLTPTL